MFDMLSFTVFSVFALFTSLISLAVFLLNGYAFYKISKLRFLPYPWFTFIPFLSLYMRGLIADSLKYRHPGLNAYLSEIPLAYALPFAAVINNFTGFIPLIGGIVSLVLGLLLWAAQVMIYYFIFSQYAEEGQVLPFTLLSIIPLVGPILILYSVRDRRA